MIVLKQEKNQPAICGIGFEVIGIIYYIQYYTGKTLKLIITNTTENNPILAHTLTWPNGIHLYITTMYVNANTDEVHN